MGEDWTLSRQCTVSFWVLLKDHLFGPWGVVLGCFKPKYTHIQVSILPIILDPSQHIKYTTAHYNTLERLKTNFQMS